MHNLNKCKKLVIYVQPYMYVRTQRRERKVQKPQNPIVKCI